MTALVDIQPLERITEPNVVRDTVFDERKLKACIRDYGLERTLYSLELMRNSLYGQLAEKDGDPDWRHRTLSIYGRSIVAIERVKRWEKRRGIAENHAEHALIAKWGGAAFDLAIELHQLDPEALDQMQGPGGTDDVSMLDWAREKLKKHQARGEDLDVSFD